MKVEVSREDLLACLDLVSKGVSPRSTLAILSSVLIKATAAQEGFANGVLELTTTNLELVIRLPMSATVFTPGAAAVPFRVLVDTLKEIGDEKVTLELDTLRFNVRFSTGIASLIAQTAEEFPLVPVPPDEEMGVLMPAVNMSRLIARTTFAAASKDDRPILTGVLMEIGTEAKTLRGVATDGYRLCLATETVGYVPEYAPREALPLAQAEGVNLIKKVQTTLAQANILTVEDVVKTGRTGLLGIKGLGEKTVDHLIGVCQAIMERRGTQRTTFIVPASSLDVVGRIISKIACEQVVMYQSRQLTFQIGSAMVSTQFIEGNFPMYQPILPNENRAVTELLFVCEALRGALKLTDVLAKHTGHSAKVRVGEKDGQTGIFLAAASAEHGDNSQFVPAVLTGTRMELAVNSQFIREGLAVMGEDVIMRLSSSTEPVVLRPDNNSSSFLYLVMPMQFGNGQSDAPAAPSQPVRPQPGEAQPVEEVATTEAEAMAVDDAE